MHFHSKPTFSFLFLLFISIFTLNAQEFPRLLVTPERIDEIKAAIQVPGSAHQEAFAAMKAEVDANGEFIVGGGNRVSSIWNYGRSYVAMRAGLLYQLTGEQVYADLAYDALYAVHNDPDPSNRLPNEGYGLARATVGLGFAFAYDFCQDGWTQEQRNYVRGRIIEALDAWPGYSHANLNASHRGSNWVAVCRGAELVMMLSVREQETRETRFNFLKNELNLHMANYGSMGWNQEGDYYMAYAKRFVLLAALGLEQIGDNTLVPTLTQQREVHHIAMYGGMFDAAQNGVQWGVGSGGFGAEGRTSLLFGIVPEAELPAYKWFYDRYRGPLNPAPPAQKYDRGAAGDVYALLFYPEALTASDPAALLPHARSDSKGGHFFRNRWQDADDVIVSLGTDTTQHGNAWDEADALQLNLMGFGTKFTGGPASGGQASQFNQILVNGNARANASDTGTAGSLEVTDRGGYAIAGGGSKYTALGLSAATRHVLVDFPEDEDDFAVVATLDHLSSTDSRLYTWQLNTQNLPAIEVTGEGVPTFLVRGEEDAYLKGWIFGPPGVDLETGAQIRASLSASNLSLWVVMAMGRGSAPVAEITGSGLNAQVRIGNRQLSYNAGSDRMEIEPQPEGPVARFDASTTDGIAPLSVQVDASASTGTGLSYAWDFGGGNTATGVNASHTFTSRAEEWVTLTVTDSQGRSDQAGKWVRVRNTPAVAIMTYTPDQGDIGMEVQFNASDSFDPDGHALSFHWDFGDGNTATGSTASHTYSERGLFYPVLTVNDGHGDSDIAVGLIRVGKQDPLAVAAADTLRGLPPLTVHFNGGGSSDPENDTLTFHWDFGDGNSSDTMNPAHTFTDFGIYTVILTVTDSQGNSSQDQLEIRVENRPPVATFAVSETSGISPFTVTFDASASYDPDGSTLTYAWDFGDGNSASGVAPAHTYATPGNYTVTLTVTDQQGGQSLALRDISALDAQGRRAADFPQNISPGLFYQYYTGLPNESFPQFDQMTPAFTGVVPNITARTRNATEGYAFRFSGFLLAPEDGEYTFHYTVRDSMLLRIGGTDVIADTQRSLGEPNSGSGSIQLQAGFHPILIGHHYAEHVWPDWTSILDLQWELPGSPGILRGIPDEVFFHEPSRPEARFLASPSPRHHVVPETVNFLPPQAPGLLTFYAPSANEPLEMSFDAGGSRSPGGEIKTYIWSFSDGDTAIGDTLTRSFPIGEHAITLTVTDSLGARAGSGITLRVLAPPARINRAREAGATPIAQGESGIGPKENAFNDDTNNRWLVWAEDSWIEMHWQHDGQRQQYLIDTYTVTNPRAWNDRDPLNIRFFGSNDGINWELLDEQLNIDWGGLTAHTLAFDLNEPALFSSFRWEIEPTAESPQGWIVEIPNLQLFDGGTANVQVNRPPVASLTASSLEPVSGETVFFDGSASYDPDLYPLTFFWDFGDGQTAHTRSPHVTHTYTRAGTRNVRLTVRDSRGGLGQDTLTLTVAGNQDSPPVAAFDFTPDRLDHAGQIQFDASASHDPAGGGLEYRWEFGDGSKGSGVAPAHFYPSGIFTATLTVVNPQGLSAVHSEIIEVLPEIVPDSIGINFAREGILLDFAEYAGYIPTRNWNKLTGNISNVQELRDTHGTPTSASFSSNGGSARYQLDGSMQSANARLLGSQVGLLANNTITSTISDIPYAYYDVYVYWAGITAERTTGVMSVSDGTETLYLRDNTHQFDGLLSESTATSAAAAVDGNEFVVFRGRTDNSISITTVGPASRTGPAAIQIVDRTASMDEPVALFTVTPESGTAPLEISVDASASISPDPIVAYRWDWTSNGTEDLVSSEPTASHLFEFGGTWSIHLTVEDSQGRTASTTRQITLESPPTGPVAVIAATPTTGEAPLSVQFDGSNSFDQEDLEIVAWYWDWNNNGETDAQGVTASHSFAAGNHTVVLTVENSAGEIAVTTVLITATAPLDSNIISLNFGGTEIDPNDLAGVEPASRWNNVGTGMAQLVDGAGNVTQAALASFSASNYTTQDDPDQSGDHRMMQSYRGTLGQSFSLTLENLPAVFTQDGYDVIVYFGGSRNDSYAPKYSINDQSFVLKDNQNTWSGTHSRSTATTAAEAENGHSYVRFENLSDASFTLLIERDTGAQRYGISGMQIIRRTPEPPPRIELNLNDSGTNTLRIQSVTGRQYQLQSSVNLLLGEEGWVNEGHVAAGTGAALDIPMIPPASGGKFYRILME